MHGYLIIFPVDGPSVVTELTKPPPLTQLQDAVGGFIEVVPHFTTLEWVGGEPVPCLAYCDEEGKLNDKPVNRGATWLWHQATLRITDEDGKHPFPRGLLDSHGKLVDILVGNICVVTGDAKLMARL
jgi:hypothetical protein